MTDLYVDLASELPHYLILKPRTQLPKKHEESWEYGSTFAGGP